MCGVVVLAMVYVKVRQNRLDSYMENNVRFGNAPNNGGTHQVTAGPGQLPAQQDTVTVVEAEAHEARAPQPTAL